MGGVPEFPWFNGKPQATAFSYAHRRLRLAVKRVFLCVLLLTLSLRVSHANDLRTLVAESCLDCHDDAGKAGGLSLEQLGVEITQQNAATWLRALEQIERGYMPPPDHDHVLIGREDGIERSFAQLAEELAIALERAAEGKGDPARRPSKGNRNAHGRGRG